MFCSKCGKEIENGTICNECLASENTEAEVVATAEVCESAPVLESEYPEPDNAKYGFNKALMGTILSGAGLVWSFISAFFVGIAGGLAYTEDEDLAILAVVLGVLFAISFLPFIILGVINGIASIKTFISRKAPCVKPVITLVFGIIALVLSFSLFWSGFSVFFSGFAFLEVY